MASYQHREEQQQQQQQRHRDNSANNNDSHSMIIEDLSSAMEVVQIPDDATNNNNGCQAGDGADAFKGNGPLNGTTTTAPTPPLVHPERQSRRPFDDLGPPSPPVPFPRPAFERGRRDDVLCYIPQTGEHQVMKNVLFRDFSREYSDGDSRVRQAYWPNPHKKPIKTIMGHVEICYVLERCRSQCDDDEDRNENGSMSSNEADEDEDIVFQWTNRRVAVKVNYSKRIDELRTKHAEDPLKEIAAMQVIGDSHPHVMGCLEVLFDGRNLNVIMRYCSEDMFQLLQQSQMRPDSHQNPGMPEGVARYWIRQIVDGLAYLHNAQGICHRDLSPENIMIEKDTHCLIIDMGMCLRVPYLDDDTGTVTANDGGTAVTSRKRRCLFQPQGACGKLPYMSPEVYRNRDPFDGQAVDLFAVGVICFCALTGNRSFARPHDSDAQFYWMTHGLDQLLSDWNVQLTKEGMHLLQNLLQADPRLRLTLEETQKHPWFAFPDETPDSHHNMRQGSSGSSDWSGLL